MARPPKPWWRAERQEYCVVIRGVTHRLGPDKEDANRKFHELMVRPPAEPRTLKDDSVAATMDLFLQDCQIECAEDTYHWYRKHCQEFLDYLKKGGMLRLSVAELRPHHVKSYLASKSNWSSGTKNGACRAVQRAFNWAAQMGHIEQNPIAFIPKKPKPGKRENIVTPDEYKTILGLVRDEDFKDLLVVSWESGCRPQESLRVERRHVNEEISRWEFPPEEAKGKKKVRFVYLTDNALTICRRRMLKHPDGPIFRNARGRPWTPNSVSCRFGRLVKQLGRKIALYDFRHSFTERFRQAGVDSVNIAALLGHADLSMIGRVYAHPHVSPQHLLELLKKGTG